MSETLAKQRQLHRMIERSLDNFKKLENNSITPAKIRARIGALKEVWNDFLAGHAALTKSLSETAQQALEYFKENVVDATEEVYLETLDYMAECLEEMDPPVSPNTSHDDPNRPHASAFSTAHLPPIKLPPFDGTFEQWENFRDRFTALIIKNRDLNNFARMHFLTSSVKGRALDYISSIPVTAENFEPAWQALTSRYENKRRLLSLHLSTLINLTAISRESAGDLQALLDKVNVAVASFDNLTRTPADLWNDILVYLIVQKLDPVTRKAWNVKTSDADTPPSFQDLTRFLECRTRALENFSGDLSNKSQNKATTATKIHAATASASTKLSCPACNASHYLSACPTFVRGNSSQRRDLVRQHKRCFNCLSHGHSVKECKSKYSCRVCHQRHHSMLHESSDSTAKVQTATASTSQSSESDDLPPEVRSNVASTKAQSHPHVLLATALVKVSVSSGRYVEARALLDQGSEMTFISENLAQRLRAPRIRMPISVSGVGCVNAGTHRHAAHILISPLNEISPSLSATALILRQLTTYAPKRIVDISSFAHFRNLRFADSNPTSADPISIIIGADLYNDILLEGLRKGDLGAPIAQNSIFGWVVSGPIDTALNNDQRRACAPDNPQPLGNVSVHHCLRAPSLADEIKKFWEIEELPRKALLSADDEQCEMHFRTTHARSSDGRYIVRLPFKKNPPIDIGASRARAENTLDSLTRRLRKNPQHAAEYTEFLTEYEQLGHMRQAPVRCDAREQQVFIPHHPVFREGSMTTHLRVVFNASSVTSNGTTLNDHLFAGPPLQTELPAVILRWRQFKFVYTADIAKMFRQIQIHSRDVKYQQILWKTDMSHAPKEYQLLTVTYGMVCAPFLALRVLQQLATDEGPRFPLAVPILKRNIYVDDVLFGGDDIPQILQIRDHLVEMLRSGGFELRKWASNSPRLLEDIDIANHGLACTKSLSKDERLKILGVGWNPFRDAFQVTVELDDRTPESKRAILSTIAKIYDPLGWVTPATITAKIFLQQLWRVSLDWDDVVPEALLTRWKQIYAKLPNLNGLQIPRWTGFVAGITHAEFHGFADASNTAYAAVVYLKLISSCGKVTISLLAGKSRVAPLTPLSIPRLELSAAVLLTRLLEFVRNSLDINTFPCYCWTDSTIVLAWLKQHPSRWKTFVANRVADIKSRLPNATWQHVPTEDNPADCASRGLLGNEIASHTLWWQGPKWLKSDRAKWPHHDPSLPADAPLEQKITALNSNLPTQPFDLASRFSSWPTLIRVTAYMFRFVSMCRQRTRRSQTTPPQSLALTADECSQAKNRWIKRIQTEIFSAEISRLERGQPLSAKSPILALNPFLDVDGLLRVGGRINQAPMSFGKRHPILLDSHPVVHLITDHAHKRSLHAGIQLTLNTLRRDYWILRARNLVKSVIHRCVICTRERAAIPSQQMGELPAVRVTAPTRSFLHCGLDYAGPVQVRASAGRGIAARKAYIALFVCLATRAIHLELVSDYSTAAFINAYARFCARRGLPRSIYSDNGTTFVGADRELANSYRAALHDATFQNTTAMDNVSWHFIPPSAPHFGGIWEAGVRSVKHHLRRVLRNRTLTFEEFATLLCQIEACLNSRPIAPLSDTLTDYEPLTPGHFLIGSAVTAHPEPSVLEINENRLSRWQLVRQMFERFWRLWYNDYINTLQQRTKWQQAQPSINPGQLVLLRNSTLPPCKWDLGRVIQCHPGPDGLTRVVTVKTSHSEFKRPISKLCFLPVQCQATST